MNLLAQQRKLLGLLRSSYDGRADPDPYIRTVAASADLLEARRNILLWRVYVLERTCALTFTLLKSRGELGDVVEAFIRQRNISPFRETQGEDFLDMLATHPDHLVASVAQFERGLMQVRAGASGPYVIVWTVDPHLVLHRLATKTPLDRHMAQGQWRTVVSPLESRLFRIDRMFDSGEDAVVAVADS
jgi:hypothetical protein